MMNKLLLSIIVPVYNVEQFIEKCIDSLLNQNLSKEEYEIIAVNDGSTDKSLSILEKLRITGSNLLVISQENKGLSAARNTGLKQARGRYTWFVDSDDWIEKNCLEMVTNICISKNLDVLQICAANVINGVPHRRFYRQNEYSVIKGSDCLKKRLSFCAPFSIYRTLFLKENDLWFYEGIYHEDNDFTPRVFSKANRVLAINDILYYVYLNPNSITRTVNPKKSLDCILVMNRLSEFQKSLEKNLWQSFDNIITTTMNVALHDTIGLEKEDMKAFTKALNENKHLFRHLWRSNSWVYKIESILMYLFPMHPIEVYRFLNFFDRRSIKGKED